MIALVAGTTAATSNVTTARSATVITGDVVSSTVMVADALPALLAESVAV